MRSGASNHVQLVISTGFEGSLRAASTPARYDRKTRFQFSTILTRMQLGCETELVFQALSDDIDARLVLMLDLLVMSLAQAPGVTRGQGLFRVADPVAVNAQPSQCAVEKQHARQDKLAREWSD
jgi:hypothetical protein